ncbi:hypothetical protein G5V59_18845 [Nocardioides sp. W3-2-3]|nr:hypothetical protein [Nocardioides convexus]
MGCPGPDALCDLGGDALDCASDPIDCGKDAAGDVKDGAGNVLDGAGNLLPDGCGILDAICGGDLPGLPGLPGVPGLPGIPGLPNVGDVFGGGIPGVGDIPNPFEAIGDVIAKAAADAWTAAMLAVWNSGLFVLRIVLTFSEPVLDPRPAGRRPRQGRLRLHPVAGPGPGGHLGDDPGSAPRPSSAKARDSPGRSSAPASSSSSTRAGSVTPSP